MMNIRIGNDVRIRCLLRGPEGFNKGNVKLMRVYFIHQPVEEYTEADITKYLKRYPLEPFPQFYNPTKYTLNSCNPHSIYDKCIYNTFGFNDYHCWPTYNGFGVTPDKFIDCTIPKLDQRARLTNELTFLAPSEFEAENMRIAAYFPAESQLYAGPYKMVVILSVYDAGWGPNHLHTYTIDYGTVFNLVSDNIGVSGNITINLDQDVDGLSPITRDIYLHENKTILLGDKDANGNEYGIYVSYTSGTKEKYPNVENIELTFESSNPNVIVGTDGAIQTLSVSQDTVAIVTVKNADETLYTTFNVHIMRQLPEYIGFAPTTTASQLDFNAVDSLNRRLFTEVGDVEGCHNIVNNNSGYYLWIISHDPIKLITSTSINVPLDDVQMKDGYYCYHCPNALVATDWNIIIYK